MMQVSAFDWYQGTVSAAYDQVLDALPGPFERGPGLHGYTDTYKGQTSAGSSFTVWAGGKCVRPSVQGRGADAPGVAELLRGLPWGHVVTRADSAVDLKGPGLFDDLVGLLREFARFEGLRTSVAGDWLSEGHDAGRTLYLGSRKSAVFLRCYEKGKQLGEDRDWVRVELQVRPKGTQRRFMAGASPDDAWGCGGWSSRLAPQFLGGMMPEVCPAGWRASHDELGERFDKMADRNWRLLVDVWERYGGEWVCQHLGALAERHAGGN